MMGNRTRRALLTKGRQGARKRRQLSLRRLVGTTVGMLACAGSATAQDRLSADVSLSAGVATNPFLQPDPTPTSGTATLEIAPAYTLKSDRTTLQLLGSIRLSEYTRRYPLNDNYALRGVGVHRLSPTVQINAELSYLNTVVGSSGDLYIPVGVTPVTNPVVVPPVGGVPATDIAPPISQLPGTIDDPALAGIGRRRSAYSGLGGISVALSPFDQIAARVSSSATRFPSGVPLDEFDTVAAGASYQRTLGPGFTVAITADASQINYLGGRFGDAAIYQPGFSLSRTLNARWSLTAAASVALVRIDAQGGDTRSSTAINGSVAACRRDERWNTCVNVSRATLPSSIQGVRTQTGASVTLGYRISERDDLSLVASYSHVNAPLVRAPVANAPGVLPGASTDFTSAGATYSRRIGPQLSAFVSASATKSDDTFVNRDANIEARFGIRYRFGERR